MDFLVRHITEHRLFAGAVVAAGEKGLNNRILWANVMEILDEPGSLQRGELLVTTGYGLNEEAKHNNLIAYLKERGVSGILIQPGYYIHEIPAYIIREADRYGLPVISLPKELTFSHILHVLLSNIGVEATGRRDPDLEVLRERLSAYIAGGEGQGAPHESRMRLMLAQPSGTTQTPPQLVERGIRRLQSCIQSKCLFLKPEIAGDKAMLVLALRDDTTFWDLVPELSNQLLLLSAEEGLNLYVGSSIAPKEQLSDAFSQAMECCEELKRIGAKRGICPYQNLPLFRLFEQLQTDGRAVELSVEALSKLFVHDKKHSGNYIHTLRVYFACSCNNAEASQKLFIHRHTLKNRLNKITQIIGMNLDGYYERLYLSNAMFICDYFGL